VKQLGAQGLGAGPELVGAEVVGCAGGPVAEVGQADAELQRAVVLGISQALRQQASVVEERPEVIAGERVVVAGRTRSQAGVDAYDYQLQAVFKVVRDVLLSVQLPGPPDASTTFSSCMSVTILPDKVGLRRMTALFGQCLAGRLRDYRAWLTMMTCSRSGPTETISMGRPMSSPIRLT
jgi:hypothetical protein